jgi:hypothetical protein
VLDGLQPGEQLVSQNYALGRCEMQFRLYPPEDWAHVDNAGVSEQDRDDLRAVDFAEDEITGREEVDDLSGPRGPRGASLHVEGRGQPLSGGDDPTPFAFDFGVASYHPDCHPPGQELFELSGGDEVSLVVEMLPEQLFGTCGDEELRFAPFARARALVAPGEPVTLDAVEAVALSDLSDEPERAFYACNRLAADGTALAGDAASGAIADVSSLRQWLDIRASFDLFRLREAGCEWQPPTFQEQF